MKELNEKVYKIIGACMEVHRVLGPGLEVDFYRKALEVEMAQKGLPFEAQKMVDVTYKETKVGELVIDFIVEGDVVLSLRSQDQLLDTEVQQVLRCLGFTNAPMGILINMGQAKIQYKRILPSRHTASSTQPQPREPRKEMGYRAPVTPRGTGRTREGNPIY